MAPALPVFAGEPAPTGNAHGLEILMAKQEQLPEQNPEVSTAPVGATVFFWKLPLPVFAGAPAPTSLRMTPGPVSGQFNDC